MLGLLSLGFLGYLPSPPKMEQLILRFWNPRLAKAGSSRGRESISPRSEDPHFCQRRAGIVWNRFAFMSRG